jgi:hypothetical protein
MEEIIQQRTYTSHLVLDWACSLNTSHADRILVAKPLGKQPFERQRGKWKDNSNTISEVFE